MSEPRTGQPSEQHEAPEEEHPEVDPEGHDGPEDPEGAEYLQEEPRDAVQRGALARAHADLEAGREWKARDRLSGLLADHYDAEALDLLGEVSYTMRDLPAAGAAWFGTRRRGPEVEAAIEAWRERHNDHFAQMWRSLPRSVREQQGNKRIDALRRRAERVEGRPGDSARAGSKRSGSDKAGGVDAAVVIAVVIAAFLVVCTVVGFVVVLRWMVPG
jgi:hypothetical protein